MKGKLHKGVDIPFSTTASVSTTADGRMRLHVESMKAVGVPAKGLLELFGLKLDDVVDIKKRRGVEVQDNDIILAAGADPAAARDCRPVDAGLRAGQSARCRRSTIRVRPARHRLTLLRHPRRTTSTSAAAPSPSAS